jgi:CheY-like chemotaxis protein
MLMNQVETWEMISEATNIPQQLIKWLENDMHFDLILVDARIPETNIVALLTQIRTIKSSASTPIVIMSYIGQLSTADNLQLTKIENLSIASKPIKQRILIGVLENAIKGGHSRFGPRLVSDKHEGLDVHLSDQMPLSILIADDNKANQKLAQKLLRRLGYQSDIVENGREVIEALEKESYDVICMDIEMPEVDGIEATQIIRQKYSEQDLGIIAMTANAMQGDKELYLSTGMKEYISKPIRIESLVQALKKCYETLKS